MEIKLNHGPLLYNSTDFLRSPDLEIQELDLSKEVAQKWTGFTPFLSSPPFLCYGVYFDFSQQLFTKSEVFCKYSTQTGFHKILKKYKVPVCRDSMKCLCNWLE